MAKEEPKREEHAKGKGGKAKKRQHLHEIRSVQAHDGSIVHHHTYKESPDAMQTQPERGPMATSGSPEDAGQHVQEMFAQNGAGQGEAEPEAGGEPPEGGEQGEA